MRKKKVFIVEDNDIQRENLWEALEQHGFEAIKAKTASQARELAKKHWNDLDVVTLDMRLEDPDEPHITGANIGNEFRNTTSQNPECIIFSAYAEVEYYKLAMELEVAAYLDKNELELPDLVRYIKAVALRKSLSIENPETIKKIIRIVTTSSDQKKAIKMFCQKVFAPELEICLGTPFFLILTAEKKSELLCPSKTLLSEESNEIYNILQAIAQAQRSSKNPIPLDLKRLVAETDTSLPKEYEVLQDAVLLPIFNSKDPHLSITLVLLKEDDIDLTLFKKGVEIPPPGKIIEDIKKLWIVLDQYVRPYLAETFLLLFSEWHRIKDSLMMSMLAEISQICLWVGQEQLAVLRKINSSLDELTIKKLRSMANDLAESGKLLKHIEETKRENAEYPSWSAKTVLEEVWEDIKDVEVLDDTLMLEIESDCEIEAQENDLYVVFSRLLQWFVKRPFPTSHLEKPTIKIQCKSNDYGSIIIFTDNGKRLSETIRQEIFVPFTQSIPIPFKNLSNQEENRSVPGQYLPLYIAKMIVEVKYGGELKDHTDTLEGVEGHQIVLSFMKASEAI